MEQAMRRAIIFAALFCALMNAADARCVMSEGTMAWGIEGRIYFDTDGGPCRLPLLYVGHAGEVHSFRMVASPKHGKASVPGLTVYYIPRSGYKGDDEFVFKIIGRLNGQPQSATIRVIVTVR
jgi:hypothetical protein